LSGASLAFFYQQFFSLVKFEWKIQSSAAATILVVTDSPPPNRLHQSEIPV